MLSAAFPVVALQPFLEVVEPKHRPGDDGLVDSHPRLPFAGIGKVKTEPHGIVIDVRWLSSIRKSEEVGLLYEDVRVTRRCAFDANGI